MFNDFRSIEEITGEELKTAVLGLYENMDMAAEGKQPIAMVTLPDGTFAQVFIVITTNDEDFIA